MVRWVTQMLGHCTAARYAVNKGRMVRLAEYSRDQLIALRAETGIRYDERMQGTLQLFRTQKQLDGIGKDVDVLKKDGVPFEVLDPDGCIAAEPALAGVRGLIKGGLRLPNDRDGGLLQVHRRPRGAGRRQGRAVPLWRDDRGPPRGGWADRGVETSAGVLTADTYVAALGSYTPQVMRPLGLTVPVYPVKGYSLTIPIVDAIRRRSRP